MSHRNRLCFPRPSLVLQQRQVQDAYVPTFPTKPLGKDSAPSQGILNEAMEPKTLQTGSEQERPTTAPWSSP